MAKQQHRHNGQTQQDTANEARLPGTDVVTSWVLVTPEMAREFLSRNEKNRTLMKQLAQSYAQDMRDGEWCITHQGAAIDINGDTMDAAHRFYAINESGQAQWMLITTGLPVHVREVMDRGRARSLAHALQIMGYDLADNRSVAMARSMYQGVRVRAPSLTGIGMRKFMERHKDALVCIRGMPGFHGFQAGIAGMLARAYYHVSPADLERFCLAICDQIPIEEMRPGDGSARKVSKLIDQLKVRHASGSLSRVELYRKCQTALKHYLSGVDLNNLKETADDLFPLPEEVPDGQETLD